MDFPHRPRAARGRRRAQRAMRAVYSYVLEEAAGGGAAAARGAMIVGGFEYATLGHGVRGDAVLSHSYFGTDAVLRDLSRMVGWTDSYITRMDRAARSASTGR